MAELDKNPRISMCLILGYILGYIACGSAGRDEAPQEVSFLPIFLQIISTILLNLDLI